MSCNLYRLITNKLPWPENLIGYKLSNYIMDLSKDVRIIERILLIYMIVTSIYKEKNALYGMIIPLLLPLLIPIEPPTITELPKYTCGCGCKSFPCTADNQKLKGGSKGKWK